MAKTIQIRNVPDDVHRALRSQAAAAGKSLSDYLLEQVQEVAARSTNAEIFRRAAKRGGGVSREEIVAAVRHVGPRHAPPRGSAGAAFTHHISSMSSSRSRSDAAYVAPATTP